MNLTLSSPTWSADVNPLQLTIKSRRGNGLKSTLRIAAFAVVTLLVALGAPAQSTSGTNPSPTAAADKPDLANVQALIALARADIKTQKATIVAQNLPLTADEAVGFWPLHREYEAELSKLNDRKVELIARYDQTYESMTDKQAVELAQGSFDCEAKRIDLKKKYFKKFQKVIPPRKASRFFQIENQLNMVLDLRVASSLPLIK